MLGYCFSNNTAKEMNFDISQLSEILGFDFFDISERSINRKKFMIISESNIDPEGNPTISLILSTGEKKKPIYVLYGNLMILGINRNNNDIRSLTQSEIDFLKSIEIVSVTERGKKHKALLASNARGER